MLKIIIIAGVWLLLGLSSVSLMLDYKDEGSSFIQNVLFAFTICPVLLVAGFVMLLITLLIDFVRGI